MGCGGMEPSPGLQVAANHDYACVLPGRLQQFTYRVSGYSTLRFATCLWSRSVTEMDVL